MPKELPAAFPTDPSNIVCGSINVTGSAYVDLQSLYFTLKKKGIKASEVSWES